MSGQAEPLIHGYKISRDRRWDVFNALCLVQALLGYQPERWHLESYPRSRIDRFGWTETRRYHQLHHRRNGSWKRRHLPKEQARKLLALGITNAHITDEKHDT